MLPSNLGYVESRNLLLDVLGRCLTNEEKNIVKQYDLLKDKKDGTTVDFANCIKIDDGKNNIFYLKLPDEVMKKTEEKEVEALFNNGWKNKQKEKIVNNKDEKER